MEDVRIIKSYVWHGDDCFFVSTIERDSSALCNSPPPRFYETFVYEFNWDKVEKGKLIWSNGSIRTLKQHFLVVTTLFQQGSLEDME